MSEEIILNKFSERLFNLVKEHNTDINKLAEKMGIKSKSTIYRYMNAEMSPKLTTVKYLAEYYNVNPAWLMGYDVPMERDYVYANNWNNENNLKKIVNKDGSLSYAIDSNAFPIPDTPMKVPVVGKISAGLPILAVENIEGYEYAPSSQIKKGYEYFYLRVQGDSMNLKFNEGDIVLVQKQDTLENDEIGVILVNGFDATVKKYKNNNGIVVLEPMSNNPANTVQIYNAKDVEIKIIGKVVSYQGKVN